MPFPADVEAAVLALERRGAIVKPFRVDEADVEGIVVRLGDENSPPGDMITAAGLFVPAVLALLRRVPDLLLEIRGPALRDAGLPPLTDLPRLRGLDLAGTRVTSRGVLETVRRLARLELLDLSFLPLSPAAIASLGTLQRLRVLSLRGVEVPVATLTTLRQSLPTCQITTN